MELLENKLSELIELYNVYGSSNYLGEKISQLDHAVECALLAQKNKWRPAMIMSAFFHDIAQLPVSHLFTDDTGGYGSKTHAIRGANFLRKQGFSEDVCMPIELHVTAKRYLVTVDATYREKLSEASTHTLLYQGGLMSEDEIHEFQNHPYFRESIVLRTFDDQAKNGVSDSEKKVFFAWLSLISKEFNSGEFKSGESI